MLTKICGRCKKDLPLTDFYPSPIGKFKVGSICRKCESDRHKEAWLIKTGQTEIHAKRNTIARCHEHAALHGGKCLSTEYKNSKTKYKWECSCGNVWLATLPVGKDKWCPACGIKNRKNTKLAKYGDANFNNREKCRQTCLVKYSTTHNMKNRDVALKNAKSRNDSSTLFHWKTGEEIVCVGSYERIVIEYLNKNCIDYKWQIPFELSNGKTFIIDLFLIDSQTYVEIKGWLRDSAKEKWDLFLQEYPLLKAEMWMKSKIREIQNLLES